MRSLWEILEKTKIKQKLENLEERIREDAKIVRYVIPSALIGSNIYGRTGYLLGQQIILHRMVTGGKVGKEDSKVPTIFGIIGTIVGFIAGVFAGDYINSQQIHHLYSINHYDKEIINNLQHQLQQDNITISNLEKELQYDNQTINMYQQQLSQANITISNLQGEVQQLYHQLQNINTLRDILFGKSNSYDISIIQIGSVKINNETAIVQGTAYPSGDKVILKIPMPYVGNNNVTIHNIFNIAQQNNWNSYIAIDRGDLPYLKLSYQGNIPIITIQPNEPVNIGVIATPADPYKTYYVLNHLTNYNIVIQDGINVYNNSNALWGYTSGGSVIIEFSNNYQYNLAEKMINIADQIINSPGNQNPTSEGIVYTYSITSQVPITTYQNYPQFNVGPTYIPIIVLESEKGNTIINTVSS
jgi:gas vesicle protein